ncbi:uncharacterized protein PHACADRAFT_247779 [Phanerochaete carnosa HHB-10118-sp]|uniref:Xylanolytic transcriptional activator regulatory domain-containing protein n=1 Tax=Phanerochaete carnosa (strain HHB-10118-sp) TaxID=650164 RepID=K5XE11_PHACS|nr:uncharacterized protein PHACADRAFT_247779 [Phanerochaete carnosa HHB-10118-sp]EKM61282.1 hypothetical protein PHACADRAFT_247779 [Phanerochaete carnosa HHB-10118-sp]
MEELLRKVMSEGDLSRSLSDSIDPGPSTSFGPPPKQPVTRRVTPPVDGVDSDDEELAVRQTLEEKFKHISLDPGKQHFIGKSSNLMFIQTALEFQEGSSSEKKSDSSRDQTPSTMPPFFDSTAWFSRHSQKQHQLSFPDNDLLHSLLATFFTDMNVYFPVLHRPTFERAIAEELHLRDEGFGSVLLLVCALGARSSKDPRVYADGKHNPQAAGWEWFNQVQQTMKVINMEPPSLYDLQAAYLASMFLYGLTSPQSSWPILGFGFRLAQAIGAHRRKDERVPWLKSLQHLDGFVNVTNTTYSSSCIPVGRPRWHFAGRLGDALNELVRAGDLLPPEENDCSKTKLDAKGKGKGNVREASISSEASETLRDSQSPASSTLSTFPASNKVKYDGSAESYEYLPVRSEDLGRQPYQYEYNRGMPGYPTNDYGQYPGAPAWGFSPTNTVPQDTTVFNSPFNGDPTASDGFMRTLATMAGATVAIHQPGGFMQAAQSVSPSDVSNGENMLGMLSNLSGNMQWDEWGNYLANLQPQDNHQWQGR